MFPSSSSSSSSFTPSVRGLRLASTLFFALLSYVCTRGGVEPVAAAAPSVAVGNISRVEEAQYFHIYYGQTFKVIKNSIDGKSYLLMQNNSRMATRAKYCTGRIKSFVIPLVNYSVDAADFPMSFLELLGVLDGLKGITSDTVTSQCVLRSISTGSTAVVNRTDTKQLQQFPAHFVGSSDQASQSCSFVTFAPLVEVTPLQRAEWIKYLGTFANAEVRANAVFDAVKSNYNCLCKMAAGQTSRFKPVAAWVQYDQGVWSFAKEAYKKQYVTDAGGENVDDDISSSSFNVSVPDDMENFHAILCTVDVVIDQTYAAEPAEYTMSSFLGNIDVADKSCFAFLSNQSIWRYDKRAAKDPNTIDWFDGGVSQPQLVLADLIEAFFPTGNYTTTYFRNIAKGDEVTIIDPDMCDRSSRTPLEPTVVPCQM